VSEMTTATLSEFLKERLAEERLGWKTQQWQENEGITQPLFHFGRRLTDYLLEDIESKRAIVDLHRQHPDVGGVCDTCPEIYPCATLRLLAAPFRGYADYREEWG
jgi:hypothetical protein